MSTQRAEGRGVDAMERGGPRDAARRQRWCQHRGRGVAQGDGAQTQMGMQGRGGGHRIQGGGETNSGHVWGKEGSFCGMKEKGNPTRSRLRRGWGTRNLASNATVTRDTSRDIISIVGVLKSALDRVGVCVTIPRYHRAGELRGKMADRPSLRPTAFGRN
jgi:hypothetical protein